MTKRVQDSTGTLTILHDIDFTLPAQRSVAIVGASGSGKSTLLSIIAGLDTPTTGTVRLAGIDLFAIDEDARAARARRQGGLRVPELPAAGQPERARERDAAARAAGPLRCARAGHRHAAAASGLGERLRHYPRVLSGGEQQRVALARAFVVAPAVLLADEPTGSLDFATGETVMELMFELNREAGTTLVLVTHDRAIAARCDRQLRIEAGRIEPARRPAERSNGIGTGDAAAARSERAPRPPPSVRELVVRLRLGAQLVAERRGLLLRQALLDLRP